MPAYLGFLDGNMSPQSFHDDDFYQLLPPASQLEPEDLDAANSVPFIKYHPFMNGKSLCFSQPNFI